MKTTDPSLALRLSKHELQELALTLALSETALANLPTGTLAAIFHRQPEVIERLRETARPVRLSDRLLVKIVPPQINRKAAEWSYATSATVIELIWAAEYTDSSGAPVRPLSGT